jgi:hypothetical protein
MTLIDRLNSVITGLITGKITPETARFIAKEIKRDLREVKVLLTKM